MYLAGVHCSGWRRNSRPGAQASHRGFITLETDLLGVEAGAIILDVGNEVDLAGRKQESDCGEKGDEQKLGCTGFHGFLLLDIRLIGWAGWPHPDVEYDIVDRHPLHNSVRDEPKRVPPAEIIQATEQSDKQSHQQR
jgi:hypothetical protein